MSPGSAARSGRSQAPRAAGGSVLASQTLGQTDRSLHRFCLFDPILWQQQPSLGPPALGPSTRTRHCFRSYNRTGMSAYDKEAPQSFKLRARVFRRAGGGKGRRKAAAFARFVLATQRGSPLPLPSSPVLPAAALFQHLFRRTTALSPTPTPGAIPNPFIPQVAAAEPSIPNSPCTAPKRAPYPLNPLVFPLKLGRPELLLPPPPPPLQLLAAPPRHNSKGPTICRAPRI